MEATTFVLFGATGDLAKRKIYPALYQLFIEGKIPASFSVIGLGRREVTDVDFRQRVEHSIIEFARQKDGDTARMGQFLSAFQYCSLNVHHAEDYKKLLHMAEQREAELGIPGNRLFYLSVAPEFFEVIAGQIRDSGLAGTQGWKRLIIEKPFGHDLESARKLNEHLSQAFAEEEIYRIDHYLGKPMIQNLETLKFANPLLQGIWNREHIANIQITASETVGVEERAAYYDHSGALRDMIQNHLLQMLMMTAMPEPEHFTPEGIRTAKRKVMEAIRPLQTADVSNDIVRGQYTAAEHQGTAYVGYLEEPGIEADSSNDTFIAARAWIDNEQWRGVPFYLRSGKRMKEKSTRIVVEFKSKTSVAHTGVHGAAAPNLLVISVNPQEGASLQLNSTNPLNGELEKITMDFHAPAGNVPEAYERLILDAWQGDSTFFAHWAEVELSWAWVQPILDAFQVASFPLYPYPAGSCGPQASDDLLASDGFRWHLDAYEPRTKEIPV
ncbi:glucose-6-phosphate dehydrogenase [Paenibacillus massiliensis]|uniref:glucose-6-phosphate dehydrogenase n=1 Tax=Paenibacillus massiliensis TaxID=225917 RepID=UPI0003724140|nr:glucose-6-phosphate dehydrogenase [Paenibacillus massiliensis]